MTLVCDLHTHTACSDGTLAPAELVARAHAEGVGLLALTDHDVTDGLAEAAAAAARLGMRFVPGVEVSATWRHETVHIVGLGIDPGNARLQAGLARLRERRDWRAREIGARLKRKNIADAYAQARALVRGRVVSRTHFAQSLVRRGLVPDLRQAFRQYLGRGCVGHVPMQWAGLDEAIDWIRAAGGIAVLAHPTRYRVSSGQLRRLLTEFRDHGGGGLEVVCPSHRAGDIERMARLARALGLLGSCGSDYHGPEQTWSAPGRLARLPEDVVPLWRALGAAA
jgi:predicted metal-dependent phosphoesterase TrpH